MFDRIVGSDGDEDPKRRPAVLPRVPGDPDPFLVEWAATRRESLIMELRTIDDILIRAGRLSRWTLPRRGR